MDCSTGKGGEVKGVRIMKKSLTTCRNNKKSTILVKIVELFFRCLILILAYKEEFLCGLTR
jgi:hypothetical protein